MRSFLMETPQSVRFPTCPLATGHRALYGWLNGAENGAFLTRAREDKVGMIEVLPFLLGVVIYLGIGGFLVYLALRFVRAAEKLAHSAEQIANKP
ncbi:MAG: hypothetical protein VX255_08855 [Candidatus Latescibacterota bacterium]|nr:hypothetical protein [Candidatus Latescibacterota bacterium]